MNRYFVEVCGIQIEILESEGTSAPVFLFHGNSSCAELYEPLLSSVVGNKYRLIAVSFPGHGASEYFKNSDAVVTISSLGAFTAQVTQLFSAKSYILIGQSLGGHALLEALDLHEKAIGLCLISSPPISLNEMSNAFSDDPIDGLLFKNDLNDDEVRRFANAFIHQENGENLAILVKNIKNTDGRFREKLGKGLMAGLVANEIESFNNATIPVAMLRGTEDKFLAYNYYETLNLSNLWSGNVITFTGCGHSVSLDNPEYFYEVLLKFIDDVFSELPKTKFSE